ncbi:MAG: M23 family metallopeptidase [bacterium]|nr:M23 family metallopeptidase [bacterium]
MFKILFKSYFIILLLFFYTFGLAGGIQKEKKNLDSIKKNLNAKKEYLKKSKKYEKKIKKDISNIYNKITKTKKNIKKLKKSLDKHNKDYDENLEKIKEAKQKEIYYQKMLSYEIFLLYKQRFLSGNKFFDMLNAFYSGKSFLYTNKKKYNMKAILSHNKNIYVDILDEKAKFNKKKAKLDKDIIYLNNKKTDYTDKKHNLTKKHKYKTKKLNQEQRKQEQYKKEIKDLEITAKKLEALLVKLMKKAKQKRSKRGDLKRYNEVILDFGVINAPVDGKVILSYGRNKHPKLNTFHISNGIEVEAQEGESIKTILPGLVVFCDKFSSYGNTVIIDHNEGVYTVYSYLNKVNVTKNDIVSKNDIIGFVGYSNYSRKNALYFEIRIDGVAMDPEIWINM